MPTALARIRPVLVPGAALALALTLALARPAGAAAQADPFNFPFSSGQAVAPFFDGWSRNPDGTYALHFGYINRNHVEELHLPVGADNRFESGGIDQGQPTFFYPRVHRRMFSVTVPADWGDRELVWSLTARGQRQQAIAWLDPLWEIDPVLGGRAPTEEQRVNRPPTLAVTAARRTVRLPDQLAITVQADDDGVPRTRGARRRARGQETPPTLQPPAGQPRAPVNVPILRTGARPSELPIDDRLTLTWTVLRGPASVTVAAASGDARAGEPATALTATFSAPGDYLLRATLSDGHLTDVAELEVRVERRQRE